eukprot:scaffold103562_cov64-Phaeocystis_antarctica.AAC.5
MGHRRVALSSSRLADLFQLVGGTPQLVLGRHVDCKFKALVLKGVRVLGVLLRQADEERRHEGGVHAATRHGAGHRQVWGASRGQFYILTTHR